jgi:hypothetical protein
MQDQIRWSLAAAASSSGSSSSSSKQQQQQAAAASSSSSSSKQQQKQKQQAASSKQQQTQAAAEAAARHCASRRVVARRGALGDVRWASGARCTGGAPALSAGGAALADRPTCLTSGQIERKCRLSLLQRVGRLQQIAM